MCLVVLANLKHLRHASQAWHGLLPHTTLSQASSQNCIISKSVPLAGSHQNRGAKRPTPLQKNKQSRCSNKSATSVDDQVVSGFANDHYGMLRYKAPNPPITSRILIHCPVLPAPCLPPHFSLQFSPSLIPPCPSPHFMAIQGFSHSVAPQPHLSPRQTLHVHLHAPTHLPFPLLSLTPSGKPLGTPDPSPQRG